MTMSNIDEHAVCETCGGTMPNDGKRMTPYDHNPYSMCVKVLLDRAAAAEAKVKDLERIDIRRLKNISNLEEALQIIAVHMMSFQEWDNLNWLEQAHLIEQRIKDLQSSLQSSESARQAAEAKLQALIENRTMWPEELRNAVDELERQFDCEMVSIEHHARWVDRVEAAEGSLRVVTSQRDDARQCLADLETAARAEGQQLRQSLAALEAENERVKKASRTRADYDLRCGECGAAHNLDTSIPSDLWNQIAAPADILCVLCIDEKLTKKGLQCDVAEFYYVGTSLSSRKYAETSGEIQRLNREIATLTSDNSHLSLELEAARAKARGTDIAKMILTLLGDEFHTDMSGLIYPRTPASKTVATRLCSAGILEPHSHQAGWYKWVALPLPAADEIGGGDD
jgi:hypothetical protein